ncbi:MAG: hypothetical protein QM713_12570 [Arachnia sp.]
MQITGARARRLWPPQFGWQLGLTLVTVACIAIEIVREGDDPVAVRLGSLSYYTEAPTVFGLMAAAVLLWYAPTAGAVLLLACSLAAATVPGLASLPANWAIVALGAAVFLARRALTRAAAARIDAPRGTLEGDIDGTPADRRRLWGALLTAGAILAGIVLLVVHHLFLAGGLAFQERAQHHDVEVVKVDGDLVTVSLGGGARELDGIDLPRLPEVGDTVEVLVDPEDQEHVEFADAPEDPSWLLALALLSLPAAWVAAERFLLPAVGRPRLFSGPVPQYEARLLTIDDTAYLLPVDASWPATSLGDLDGLVAFEGPEDEEDEEDEEFDDDPQDFPETPEELRRWLDADVPDAAEERELERAFGPYAERPIPVTVSGTPRPGASIALTRDGDTWVTEVDPATVEFRLRGTLRRATADGTPYGLFGALATSHPRVLQGLWAAVCVVGVAVVCWLLRTDGEADWVEILIFTAVWAAGVVGYGLGEGSVTLLRDRIVLHGMVFDETIAASQVSFGIAVEDGVALRLRDPDDVIVLAPEALTRRASSTPKDGLATLEAWRQAAPQGALGGRRPSVLLWGAIAVVAVGLINLALLLG